MEPTEHVEVEVALFEGDSGGVRLLWRSRDPDVVAYVHDRMIAKRRRELAALEGPVRLVQPEAGGEDEPAA